MIIQSCNITPIIGLPGSYVCHTHSAFMHSGQKSICGVYEALIYARDSVIMVETIGLENRAMLVKANDALEVLAHGSHNQHCPPENQGG